MAGYIGTTSTLVGNAVGVACGIYVDRFHRMKPSLVLLNIINVVALVGFALIVQVCGFEFKFCTIVALDDQPASLRVLLLAITHDWLQSYSIAGRNLGHCSDFRSCSQWGYSSVLRTYC